MGEGPEMAMNAWFQRELLAQVEGAIKSAYSRGVADGEDQARATFWEKIKNLKVCECKREKIKEVLRADFARMVAGMTEEARVRMCEDALAGKLPPRG
jgi:hypothetical protein